MLIADEPLVAEFDQEMFRIYERARSEANYNATRFLHMLYEHRGLEVFGAWNCRHQLLPLRRGSAKSNDPVSRFDKVTGLA